MKCTKETILKSGNSNMKVLESGSGSNIVGAEKSKALSLISILGCDMKQADEKFRFIMYEQVVEFF